MLFFCCCLFWFSVFGIWRFWFLSLKVCVSLLASFPFFKIWLQPHDLPSLLDKSFFFFLPPVSHTQFHFSSLPSASLFLFQPIKSMLFVSRRQAKTLLHATSPAVDHYLVSNFPPSVLLFSLSSPSSFSLCFLPSSICVYFWLQKTSAGRQRKRETKSEMDQTERWLWLKGEVVNLDF